MVTYSYKLNIAFNCSNIFSAVPFAFLMAKILSKVGLILTFFCCYPKLL